MAIYIFNKKNILQKITNVSVQSTLYGLEKEVWDIAKTLFSIWKKNPEENRFQTLQSVDFKSLLQYHSLPGNTVVHQEKITSYYICIDPMFACIRLVTACPTFYNDGILSVSNLIHGSWKSYQNVVFLFLKLDFAIL